jgi:hypothetical protein
VLQEQAHRAHARSDQQLSQDGSSQSQHFEESSYPHGQAERLVEDEGERNNAMNGHIPNADRGDSVDIDSRAAPNLPRKRFHQDDPPETLQLQQPISYFHAPQQLQPHDGSASASMARAMPGLMMEAEAPGRTSGSNRLLLQPPSRAVTIEAQSSMSEWLSGFEH